MVLLTGHKEGKLVTKFKRHQNKFGGFVHQRERERESTSTRTWMAVRWRCAAGAVTLEAFRGPPGGSAQKQTECESCQGLTDAHLSVLSLYAGPSGVCRMLRGTD